MVSPDVTAARTSTPTSPVVLNLGLGVRLEPTSRTELVATYGLMRRSRDALPVCSPARFPASETRFIVYARGTGDQNTTSFFRRMCREKLIPQALFDLSNRRARNGIRISTVHPSLSTRVRTS